MAEGMALASASLSASSVPDSESLRRALLTASWQRDQEVGRRRLRQRWAAWAAQRIGLAALISAALGWTYLSLRPAVDGATAASAAAPEAATNRGEPSEHQLPRPLLRLDLDLDAAPSPASTRNDPQPSTPGDNRT